MAAGIARAGEFASGGIDTPPDSGRTKLNIPPMRPNLAYVVDGNVVEMVELDQIHQKNSIRHLSVAQDGTVAFGMQWQGDSPAPPLVGVHQRGAVPLLTSTTERQMQGYVGSITFTGDGMQIIATSPRGGRVQRYDAKTLALLDQVDLTDACGAAATPQGVIITTGAGQLVDLATQRSQDTPSLQWDNHLVSLG